MRVCYVLDIVLNTLAVELLQLSHNTLQRGIFIFIPILQMKEKKPIAQELHHLAKVAH